MRPIRGETDLPYILGTALVCTTYRWLRLGCILRGGLYVLFEHIHVFSPVVLRSKHHAALSGIAQSL